VDQAIAIMREQRGRHFDPVLLDAFLEILGRSGPDAREGQADPAALAESTLQTYAAALERGDAEQAEGAIAKAIEEGVPATMMHGEVIAPALRRIGELWEARRISAENRALAIGITRRVLATLYRYMLGGAQATRERVLVAGVEGDEHSLELQMMHDQLAAAGFRTILDPKLPPGDLRAAVESHRPDVVLLGSAVAASVEELEYAVRDTRESHREIPIVLGGLAAGGEVPHERDGMRVLERIDESVEAVEQLLAGRTPVNSG
jgi:methanogenic corrinoid protein MtbC1